MGREGLFLVGLEDHTLLFGNIGNVSTHTLQTSSFVRQCKTMV